EVAEPGAEDAVERDERQRHEEDRQAARQRADPPLLVELLLRLLGLDPVPLVALLDLLQLRAEELHSPRRDDLAAVERRQQRPQEDRQHDDRDRDVVEQEVEQDEEDEEGLVERRDQPRDELDRVQPELRGLERNGGRVDRRRRRDRAAAGG